MNIVPLTFVDKYIQGLAKKEDILDHISLWHDTESYEIPLHKFLGLTEDEHLRFVDSDDQLNVILAKKKRANLRSKFRVILNRYEIEETN